MMTKMQPIPEQDRPKVIAVVIGIGVALTFVVRSLGGTPIQAQSGAPQTAAVPTAPPAAAAVNTALPSSEPAAGGTLPATEAGAQTSVAAGFGEVEGLPLTAPFRPVRGVTVRTMAPVARPVVEPRVTPRPIASAQAPAAPMPAARLPQPPQPAGASAA